MYSKHTPQQYQLAVSGGYFYLLYVRCWCARSYDLTKDPILWSYETQAIIDVPSLRMWAGCTP